MFGEECHPCMCMPDGQIVCDSICVWRPMHVECPYGYNGKTMVVMPGTNGQCKCEVNKCMRYVLCCLSSTMNSADKYGTKSSACDEVG